METKQLTDDQFIAQFMGESLEFTHDTGREVLTRKIDYDGYYHEWNNLMPVVGKITPLAKQLGQQAWGDTAYHLLRADIRVVYNQVLSFIKWYSNQPQKAS